IRRVPSGAGVLDSVRFRSCVTIDSGSRVQILIAIYGNAYRFPRLRFLRSVYLRRRVRVYSRTMRVLRTCESRRRMGRRPIPGGKPVMPTLEAVLAIRKKAYDDSLALVARKGADYNRDQQMTGDTLFNLKVAAVLGIVDTPAQSVLVRLGDKFMRLISLTKSTGRKAAVKSESVWDTVLDIHNYVDYLYLLWKETESEQSE